jgi:hypothetical protein
VMRAEGDAVYLGELADFDRDGAVYPISVP